MFEVCFESAHWPRGDVDVLLPIEVPQVLGQAAGWAQQQMSPAPSTDFAVLLQVAKGPTYNIRLRATVVELSLSLSKNTVHFSDILVGQCQIETVRLYNWFQVPCKWFITAIKPVMKVKHRQH
ncbi:HYDIN protein, partial [Toxostoma redivivum]|nr:HYDIN protein [Toxostoma redivivum]